MPWSVEEIELDPPRAGEVLVKLASSGLCHSDEHLVTGDLAPEPEAAARMGLERYPVIGGHEGAGEVVEVGPGVSRLKVGDHVALSFLPSCGHCPSCAEGRQQLCERGMYLQGGRQLADRTGRHHARGRDLALMCLLGRFAPYTVVHEDSCVVIDEDLLTWKGELALTMGATHAVASMAEALPLVQDLTRGAKADKAILTVGLALGEHIAPAATTCARAATSAV